MPYTPKQLALLKATNGSARARARLWGMKYRAGEATSAEGSFPYAARTCAQWEEIGGEIVERQQSPAARRKDAREGSNRLRDAILGMAA